MKGVLEVNDEGQITSFREKEDRDASLINGGFMVFEPEIFNYLDDDTTVLEKSPLNRLSQEGQLMGYNHHGFWQCMDTQREKQKLEELWYSGKAPWKIW
ncbi:MAG: glucose-1-phosphate cytidylyltransferase, partial [Clostridia bacterium]|nr:glucose-1-phosphate cytidylyltransferase [Clostridia bacterium]